MNLEIQPDDTTTIYVLDSLRLLCSQQGVGCKSLHIVSEKRESGVHICATISPAMKPT